MKVLENGFIATVTPVDRNGRVDRAAERDYFRYLTSQGVRRVLVGGGTANFAAFSMAERHGSLEQAREVFTEVLYNVSDDCLECVGEIIARAKGIADRFLLLPPRYFDLSNAPLEGVMDHAARILELAEETECCWYSIPANTRFPLVREFLEFLVQRFPHFQWVKESSGDLNKVGLVKALGLKCLVGSDPCVLEGLRLGASGAVSGGSNAMASEFLGILSEFDAGRADKAAACQKRINALSGIRLSQGLPEIPFIKTCLQVCISGFPRHCRTPWRELDEGTARKVQESFSRLQAQA